MQFKLIENGVILQGFIIYFSDSLSGLYIHILYNFQSQKPEKNASSIDLFILIFYIIFKVKNQRKTQVQ